MLTQLPQTPLIKWFSISLNLITALSLLGIPSQSSIAKTPQDPAKEPPKDRNIKIGVVQRFGTKPTDKLTLKATDGSSLTLSFPTPKGIETAKTSSVKLEVAMKPLPEPVVDERVVLSGHRSFESAEYSANQWRAKGIEVEIAQPERWQVWAKRDVYQTPLLRRLLLESLQAQGNKTAFIDTKIIKEIPRTFWVLNGFRYNRDELKITASNGVIEVAEGANPNAQITRRYGGNIQLQTNAYGTYTLVNDVPIETYLRGVVPHEIGAFSPYASIEAQAILARTYALRNVRRFAIDNYELCADTNCQVYQGLTEVYPETDKAISATRGLVITYQNELVDALYSAASGGITASFGDIWHGSERPYLKSVIDAPGNVWDLSKQSLADEQNLRRFLSLKNGFNEDGADAFRWREETSLPEMTAFMKRYFQKKQSPLGNFKAIQQVQIVERSPAGRVLKMIVQTDAGKIDIDKDEIRNAFEPPISTLFYIDPVLNPDKTIKGYIFVGGGYGHGVGMSQTGSYNLAKLGWSSDRILSFYFPGTKLVPLDESIIFWREPN